MSARLTRQAICLMLGFAVAACSPGQPNPTGPGASAGPGASSSPAAAQSQDLGAAEIALREDNRTRAGLVNLRSGASELAGLMDASAAHALQDEITRTQATIAGPTSAAPAVRFVTDTTLGSAIFAPWTLATLAYEGLMSGGVNNTRILDDTDTLPGCVPGFGTCSGDQTAPKPPAEDSGTETDTSGPTDQKVTVGGNQGVIATTTTATVAFAGSKVSIDVEVKVSGEIHDANGKTIYRIESTGRGHIDGDACPDASGIATAHIAFTASESYFGPSGGSGSGLEEDFSSDVRIRADDNANLAGVEIVAKAHESSSGGLGAGGAKGDLSAHEFNTGATFTLANDPKTGFGAPDVTGVTADSTEATNLILGMGIFALLPAKVAAKAAETAWRSGMCVRVSPSPSGADVANSSTTEVKVTVHQRYDGTELDKPVTATLDRGPKSIAPAGQALPAPATFTYTAGPKDKDVGTVTFKSVSNRGIGQTSVNFQVGGGWNADRQVGEETLKGQKCGGLDGIWRIVGTIKSAQIDSTLTYAVTINGTTLLGTYTYKSVVKSYPGIVTTGVGTGRASIVAQPDGTLKMTVFGTTITSTAVGAGAEVTISVPIPDGSFSWSPGGTCP